MKSWVSQVPELFLLKNFNFFKIFLDGLARIEEGSLTTSTCLSFDCVVLYTRLLTLTLGENLDDTFCLNILLLLLVVSTFYSDS